MFEDFVAVFVNNLTATRVLAALVAGMMVFFYFVVWQKIDQNFQKLYEHQGQFVRYSEIGTIFARYQEHLKTEAGAAEVKRKTRNYGPDGRRLATPQHMNPTGG